MIDTVKDQEELSPSHTHARLNETTNSIDAVLEEISNATVEESTYESNDATELVKKDFGVTAEKFNKWSGAINDALAELDSSVSEMSLTAQQMKDLDRLSKEWNQRAIQARNTQSGFEELLTKRLSADEKHTINNKMQIVQELLTTAQNNKRKYDSESKLIKKNTQAALDLVSRIKIAEVKLASLEMWVMTDKRLGAISSADFGQRLSNAEQMVSQINDMIDYSNNMKALEG